jgi:DNA-binding transcriptional LysR family regulator
VRASGDLRLNDDDALAEAVLGGLGVALLPTFIVGKALQTGRLRSVLQDYVPLERHIYAVYLPNRHLSAKVRAFIDFFLDHIGAEPYWDRLDASETPVREQTAARRPRVRRVTDAS